MQVEELKKSEIGDLTVVKVTLTRIKGKRSWIVHATCQYLGVNKRNTVGTLPFSCYPDRLQLCMEKIKARSHSFLPAPEPANLRVWQEQGGLLEWGEDGEAICGS